MAGIQALKFDLEKSTRGSCVLVFVPGLSRIDELSAELEDKGEGVLSSEIWQWIDTAVCVCQIVGLTVPLLAFAWRSFFGRTS